MLLAPPLQPAGCREISLAKAFLPEVSLQISVQQAGLPASGCPILTLLEFAHRPHKPRGELWYHLGTVPCVLPSTLCLAFPQAFLFVFFIMAHKAGLDGVGKLSLGKYYQPDPAGVYNDQALKSSQSVPSPQNCLQQQSRSVTALWKARCYQQVGTMPFLFSEDQEEKRKRWRTF